MKFLEISPEKSPRVTAALPKFVKIELVGEGQIAVGGLEIEIMDESEKENPRVRPYFIPPSINYDELPQAVQAAITAVVEPTYQELVLGASTALERSVGVSLSFLLCLEILDHFELGAVMDFSGNSSETKAAEREKQIARHLRLLGAKQQSANFLMRLRIFRATRGLDMFNPPAI